VREEVTSARATILRVTGEDPRPLFRFPYGESDARTVRIANGLGFVPIGWTYGSPGYLGTSGGVTVDTVVSRLTAARQPGEILLLHVGSNPDDHTTLDADALPRVITALRDAGFGFVALHVTSSGLSES
jgi:peptidoglycan/xylan/chitin deacetylase (PgdA/CDA1 family)